LKDYKQRGIPADLEPLARAKPNYKLPEAWRLRTFKDKGFLYLWSVGSPAPMDSWLDDTPDKIPAPYHIGDKEVRDEFEKLYAGRREGIPIFSDPRMAPLFHGVGPGVFKTDPKTGEVTAEGQRFAKWLDENPARFWGGMMNYHSGNPTGPKGQELFRKYRDRYVGSIAGESLGYFYPDTKKMQSLTEGAKTRRQLVEAFTPYTLELNAAKYRAVFGQDLDKNAYMDVISCLSVGNIVYAPLQSAWGARSIGYESSSATSSLLNMRWAFMRGTARQGSRTTCTYRSCNFGDASTIFSDTQSYHAPKHILDNCYSVFSGAGMT
jgi:hypothetical protein